MKRLKEEEQKFGDKKSNDLLKKDIMFDADMVFWREILAFREKQQRINNKNYAPKVAKFLPIIDLSELIVCRLNQAIDEGIPFHYKTNTHTLYILIDYKNCSINISEYHGVTIPVYTDKDIHEFINILGDKIFYPERYYLLMMTKTKLSTDILQYIKNFIN
jgi:myosin-crossreactive antigen